VLRGIVNADTVERSGERSWIRLQTQCTNDLTIYSIELAETHLVREEGLVYSLATDALVQSLAVGTIGADNVLATSFLTNAGSPSFAIVENPLGGNGIRLTNRGETWHAVDLMTPSLDWELEGNSFEIRYSGRTTGTGGTALIGGADSPWASLISADIAADGTFEVVGVVTAETVAGSGERSWFRLHTNNHDDLFIYEVSVRRIVE
jgi:hypothetical protein